MDKELKAGSLVASARKLLERNSLVVPALIIAVAMVVVAWISAGSERYQPMPQERNGISVIDTKSGDVYTWTTGSRKGKSVWKRMSPRRGIIEDQ